MKKVIRANVALMGQPGQGLVIGKTRTVYKSPASQVRGREESTTPVRGGCQPTFFMKGGRSGSTRSQGDRSLKKKRTGGKEPPFSEEEKKGARCVCSMRKTKKLIRLFERKEKGKTVHAYGGYRTPSEGLARKRSFLYKEPTKKVMSVRDRAPKGLVRRVESGL